MRWKRTEANLDLRRAAKMEVATSLNSLALLPLSASKNGPLRTSLLPCRRSTLQPPRLRRMTAVQAKGRRNFAGGSQFRQPPQQPILPKLEDDGNPKFLIYVRPDNVDIWFPLNIVTGGTTAKIMIAAKDNFLGKYVYKDTLNRNLAAVIYNDEKAIQELVRKQNRILRDAEKFRFGYKIVDNKTLRAALASKSNIILLPSKEKLERTTVVNRVKNWFEKAKGSVIKAKESVTESLSSAPSELISSATGTNEDKVQRNKAGEKTK